MSDYLAVSQGGTWAAVGEGFNADAARPDESRAPKFERHALSTLSILLDQLHRAFERRHVVWVTADVPLPSVVTVQGEVTK